MTSAEDGANRHREHAPERRCFWFSPTGIVTLGFIGVAGYFLVTEHAAHVFGVLPWLLLAACPLMHLFMHHGHGGHDHGGPSSPEDRR